jgi:DNA-binding CsgD family transcriptional regulator
MSENNGLSERELDVLKLVAKGASNKEIANELFISPNTVKVHLRKIFSKIGVTSRTEAALYAVNTGIVPSISEDQNPQPTAIMDTVLAEGLRSGDVRRRVILPVVMAIALIMLIFASIVVINLLDNSRVETVGTSPSFAVIPRWHKMAGMPTARSGLAVASVESRLYAIGGEAGEQVLGTVEMYDPESDSWLILGAKPTPVADVQAVSFGGKIYIPGGRQQSGEVTGILEIYDPRQDQWDQGAELPLPLSAYGLVSHEGKIYAFGGFDGNQFVAGVFRYDPEQDRWDLFASLPEARGYVGVASVNERIPAMISFGGQLLLCQMEYMAWGSPRSQM